MNTYSVATNLPFDILSEISTQVDLSPNIGYVFCTEHFDSILRMKVSAVIQPVRLDRQGHTEPPTAFLELVGVDKNVKMMAEQWLITEQNGAVPATEEEVDTIANKIHLSVKEHTTDSLSLSGLMPFYHMFHACSLDETTKVIKAVCGAFAVMAQAQGNYVDNEGNRVSSPVPASNSLLD